MARCAVQAKEMSESNRPFIISTDNTADFPDEFVKENNITLHYLHYIVDGETYGDDKNLEIKDFFNRMRNGATVSTFATNPDKSKEIFRKQLADGFDVLHIGFSSGLSSAYSNSATVAKELAPEFPDRRIEVIDSLCASGGQGLYVWYALKMQKEGKSMDEIIKWLNDYKLNLCHTFTGDDLAYLHRGGRISKSVKVLGNLLNIKPILMGNENGQIINVEKVRGTKKAIKEMADRYDRLVKEPGKQIVGIAHADNMEDTNYLIDLLNQNNPPKDILTVCYEPVTGSHVGPGTVALFFLGDEGVRSNQ